MNAANNKGDTGPWNDSALAKLREWDPTFAEQCLMMTMNPWTNGILPRKTVELIATGARMKEVQTKMPSSSDTIEVIHQVIEWPTLVVELLAVAVIVRQEGRTLAVASQSRGAEPTLAPGREEMTIDGSGTMKKMAVGLY